MTPEELEKLLNQLQEAGETIGLYGSIVDEAHQAAGDAKSKIMAAFAELRVRNDLDEDQREFEDEVSRREIEEEFENPAIRIFSNRNLMPKIYLTVNDETGQHRGYCTQLRIPEILTLAGAPLPCYPVEDNRTLLLRLGTQYIPIAVYEHPGKGPEDAACLSIERTARVINHLRASGWEPELIYRHQLLEMWVAGHPYTAQDLEPYLSPWNALIATPTGDN